MAGFDGKGGVDFLFQPAAIGTNARVVKAAVGQVVGCGLCVVLYTAAEQ